MGERLTKMVGFLVGAAILVSPVLDGCGKRQTVVFDQPGMPQPGYYEKAWIEPKILVSDSLFTLIKAYVVDSFYVDEAPDPGQTLAPAVEFSVGEDGCFVTANLVGDQGNLIRPLVAKNLGLGHYKITLNLGRLDPALSSTGVFYLKTDYCGFEVVEQITTR